MSISLKKIWNEYGIGIILVLLVVAYGFSTFANYLTQRGGSRFESNDIMAQQYLSSNAASNPPMVSGSTTLSSPTQIPLSNTSASGNIQDPSELLPKDTNSQWAQLNPSGQGELANVNLLKSGYHIGIDTIGSSLRNSNLQIRSEPPNPQVYTGPWNQSTITNDFMRPPLEIGSGPQ
jgi:hypothetical protein